MSAETTPEPERLLAAYDEFGWKQVKVDRELKKPTYEKWQEKTIPREELRRHVEGGGNVGIQAGQVSDWICAADLDSEEAVRLAPKFLPETLKSGKQGIPTHWIYRSPGAGYRQFRDVDRTMLLELKASENGAGHQFVVEPSTHPEKGPYRWMPAFNPALVAEVSKEDLTKRLGHLAAAVLIARNFPHDGGHDYANSLCGYLLRNGTACEDLEGILEACWPADKVRPHNVAGAIGDAEAKINRGEPVTGGRTLEELAPGLPKALAKALGWAHRESEIGETGHESQGRHLTDMGNAERLVARHGEDLRYVHPWRRWLVWDGARWKVDDNGHVRRLAKDTIRTIYAEAGDAVDDQARNKLARHAMSSEAQRSIEAMIALAQSEVPASPDELDADPWLLNAENGTVDLRTGELREHRREDLLTKIAGAEYRPDAPATAWAAFLGRVLPGEELRAFVQRAAGYSVTGDTSEQCLFINHGGGDNGKSTYQEALAEALGDYAMRAPTEMLMVKRGGGIPNDVARLKGSRFVAASETEEGRRLAESLVKDLTGQDTITARFMRAEFFDFKPSHKLWLSTNHKPEIRGTDHAIWRRIRLVPWSVTIPPAEKDMQLPEKLRRELAGVLAWAVRGCLDWQRGGLGESEEVRQATQDYRIEMDVLAAFMDECCLVAPGVQAKFSDLYAEYGRWCEVSGEKAEKKRAFGMLLKERGFEPDNGAKNTAIRRGIALLSGREPPPSGGEKVNQQTPESEPQSPPEPENSPDEVNQTTKRLTNDELQKACKNTESNAKVNVGYPEITMNARYPVREASYQKQVNNINYVNSVGSEDAGVRDRKALEALENGNGPRKVLGEFRDGAAELGRLAGSVAVYWGRPLSEAPSWKDPTLKAVSALEGDE